MQIKYTRGRPNNRRILAREDLERLIPGDDALELPDLIDWNAENQHVVEVSDEVGTALVEKLPDEFEEYTEPEPVAEEPEGEPEVEGEKAQDEKPKPNSSSKKKKSDSEMEDD